MKKRFASVWLFGFLLWASTLQAQNIESIRVHTSKEFFMPGEVLWYTLYTHGSNQEPSQITPGTVAYVELFEPSGTPVHQAKVSIQDGVSGSTAWRISADMKTGVYELVAYTAPMRSNPERFFRTLLLIVNPGDADYYQLLNNLLSTADPAEITEKNPHSGRVNMTLNNATVSLSLAEATSATVSLSVYKKGGLQSLRQGKMTTELVGSATSTEFASQPIPGTPYDIRIRYTKPSDGAPLQNEFVYLSFPGKDAQFFTSKTDSQGIATFRLGTRIFKGVRNMTTRLLSHQPAEAEVLPEFVGKRSVRAEPTLDWRVEGSLEDFLYDHNLAVQVENAYSKVSLSLDQQNTENLRPFFGTSDKTYYLDDYTRFVRMHEVLTEYVPEVRLGRRAGRYRFRVLDEDRILYFDSDPLILLDGVPIKDATHLVEYDPLKVEKIDLILSTFYQGEAVYNGVISFSTYEGNFEGFELDLENVMTEYLSFVPPVRYPHRPYSRQSERLPDFRNHLYWQSGIILSADEPTLIDISTGDQSGTYLVVLEGVDEHGALLREWTEFMIP